MKRISFRLLMLTLGFALGVGVVFLFLEFRHSEIEKKDLRVDAVEPVNKNISAPLTILNFCELADNPEKYDGQLIRLTAKLTFGVEGSWFSAENCQTSDNAAAASSGDKEIWRAIDQIRNRRRRKQWRPDLNITVTGRFKNAVFRNCCLIIPFQFEILSVEKAAGSQQKAYQRGEKE